MLENRWTEAAHAEAYLAVADTLPHRDAADAALVEHLPATLGRVLDLGCGDGRLLALVRSSRPGSSGVALDFSATMLAGARERFAGVDDVEVVEHDMASPLPELGRFDAVVSSFAIHHLSDGRKREIYGEAFDRLVPGGSFLNLEHVASPTERLHRQFLAALDIDPAKEDPSNQLAPVGPQLAWLREIGFDDVDCHWKWREMALLAGVRPGGLTG